MELFAELPGPPFACCSGASSILGSMPSAGAATSSATAPAATTEVVLGRLACPHDEVPDQFERALLEVARKLGVA